jgi:hypothetical protein
LRYQWDFRYLFIIKLNNIFWQILLQDKYNIGVLTVNIQKITQLQDKKYENHLI